MAKRQDDGTVSLFKANEFARKADADARKEREGIEKVAHQAVRNAFRSNLTERREQKNLR